MRAINNSLLQDSVTLQFIDDLLFFTRCAEEPILGEQYTLLLDVIGKMVNYTARRLTILLIIGKLPNPVPFATVAA